MYCGNRALDEDFIPLRVRYTLQSKCQAVFVTTSIEMDGTQWGMLWNRLFENLLGGAAQISTISLSQRDLRAIGASRCLACSWCSHSFDCWALRRHNGVHLSSLASSFPPCCYWEYNNLTSQPQLTWLFGRAVAFARSSNGKKKCLKPFFEMAEKK